MTESPVGASAPEHVPCRCKTSSSECNPLIVDNGWNDDTRNNVRAALHFLSVAIPAVVHAGGGFSRTSANGASLLIETCVAALEVTK